MSKAGKRLLRGAYQALAYAEGRAEPGAYRIHHPDKSNAETSTSKPDHDDTSISTDGETAEATVPGTTNTLIAVEKQKAATNISAAGA